MQLVKLRAKNFCIYKSLDLDFSEGIVGIIGSNGSGKSTLVRAWKFLLTGSTDRNKVRNLTYGSDSGFVEGTFTLHGKTYVVKRDTAGAKATLTLPNGEVLSKAEPVNSYLSELLDIHPKVFSNHVVIDQGNLTSFLSATPSEFIKELQYLTNTNNCETLRDIISKRIEKLPQLVLSTTPEQIKSELASLDTKLEAEKTKLELYESKLASIDLGKLTNQRDELKTLQYRKARATVIERTKAQTNLELKELEVAIKTNRKTIKEYTDYIAKNLQMYDDSKTALILNARNTEDQKRRFTIELQLVGDINQLKTLNSLPAPQSVDLQELSNFETLEREAYADLQASEKFINTFEKNKASKCPTCYQKIEKIDELLAEYLVIRDNARVVFNEYSQKVRTIRDTNQRAQLEHQRRIKEILTLEASIESNKALLNTLPNSSILNDETVTELIEFIKKYEEIKGKLIDLNSQVVIFESKFKDLLSYLKTLDAELKDLGDISSTFSEEVLTEIQTKITEYENLRNEIALLKSIFNYTIEQRESTLKRLEDLTLMAQQQQKRDKFRETLIQVRDLLHRDNLPRLVIQSYLARINYSYNKFLQILNFPFSVEINDELAIIFTNRNNDQVFADELSGGQKMLCSIAFRLAICEQFAQNLGLLVLDEPTAFVDEDNVKYVADVFNNIKSYTKSSGMQVLVITHDHNLAPVFDQIINVNELSSNKLLI